MPQTVKVWAIDSEGFPKEIPAAKLDLEDRLEAWIAQDASILSPDLLVFGRQVETDHGGIIDLLCLDDQGNVVVVELKRGRTPRDVTAQTIDYAAWVRHLSNDEIRAIAKEFFKNQDTLERAFQEQYGQELPEVLNESHRMLIVGTGLDSSTERIIEYLAECGVDINAATFGYFVAPGNTELVARIFLIEPDKAEYKSRTRSSSKRSPALTFEDLQSSADEAGIGTIYRALETGLAGVFKKDTTRSSLRFRGEFEGSQRAVFSLIPGRSSEEEGLRFEVYLYRLCQMLDLQESEALALLPESKEVWSYPGSEGDRNWSGFQGAFRSLDEAQRFMDGVKAAYAVGSSRA